MNKIILRVYDFLRIHHGLFLASFLGITTLMIVAMCRLDFKEDIADFLPLDSQQQEAMIVYQEMSGSNRILAIFQQRDTLDADPDLIVNAIENFAAVITELDTANMVKNLTTEFDLNKLTEITDFAYAHIPYFLTKPDYEHIDSLLASQDYVYERLEEDKQLLMFPTAGALSSNLQKDPLNIFSPIISKLGRQYSDAIELYDGHIFTSDMSRGIVMMESPFGNSETKENSKLAFLLQQSGDSIHVSNPEITVHFIGGPIIAVGNAERIKQDSILSIAIAIVLIFALLVVVFRKPLNIFLIAVSVAWGWLLGMAILSIVHESVSQIVIGISSIILGIAINYPLHLLAHMAHCQSMRQVLKEIITPLVIGNITTVGAFVTLIPIKATALMDLGIFSAFILLGTILFVVVYFPHLASFQNSFDFKSVKVIDKFSNIKLENYRWLIICVLMFTVVFAYYSTKTKFDADISHINYMTAEQKADMEYFNQFTTGESGGIQNLYVVISGSTIDEALKNNIDLQCTLKDIANGYDGVTISECSKFLPSATEQQKRLKLWETFVKAHDDLTVKLKDEATKLGFKADAFSDFEDLLRTDYDILDIDEFAPINKAISGYLSVNPQANTYRVVTTIKVPDAQLDEIKRKINESIKSGFCFDVKSMNGAISKGLSDNFNYIGWACGLIVFFFLWFSFKSIELAMLSFLPMGISWIWIMGIMGMLDIQFNIVNIILATFIFGQGDDYTIFITEGCCYEYAYRRKMLASFKGSIIVSALIMFIGIGTLIFAKHPALYSLAEVTIIGMTSVVLMAWIFPPVVFNWITRVNGQYRKRPLTLLPILRYWLCKAWWLSQLCIGYLFGLILFTIGRHTPYTDRLFHRFATWNFRINESLFPSIKIHRHNIHNEQLENSCIILCNYHSLIDLMLIIAWSPKIIIIYDEQFNMTPVVRKMFKWLGSYTISQSSFCTPKESINGKDIVRFQKTIEHGYSIALFHKNWCNPKSFDHPCQNEAILLATRLGVDVLPVLLHGTNYLMPKGSSTCYSGNINMYIGGRIKHCSDLWNNDYTIMTKLVYQYFVDKYGELCRKYETALYFKPFVIDRYRYKVIEILSEIKSNIKKHNCYTEIVDKPQPEKIVVMNCGYGELPLLLALVHPHTRIFAYDKDFDKIEIARYSAEGIVRNIEYLYYDENQFEISKDLITYDLD